MKKIILYSMLLLCCLPANSSAAFLLANGSSSFENCGINPQGFDGVAVVYGTGTVLPECWLTGGDYLFTGTGQVVVNENTDSDWFTAVDFLTNGLDDGIEFGIHQYNNGQISEGQGIGWTESPFFGTTPDLYNSTIEYIIFDVTHYQYDDISSTLDIDIAVSIYGIPEPMTLLLLGMGGLLIRKQ